MFNGSGMNNVAVTMCAAEKALGLDSQTANPFEAAQDILYDKFCDFDIHVTHTYFPEWFKRRLGAKKYKLVWLGHGTPEYVFYDTIAQPINRHGINDAIMLQQHYLQHSDAVVTSWPRHKAIYETLVDKRTPVHLVPMGIDKTFWKPTPSQGKFAGEPSLLWSENSQVIKFPYDLLIAWPWVYPKVKTSAVLHITRLPLDQHRWFFPLINRNGSAYAAHISNIMWGPEDLRNALCSVDYQIGLVWKGDFNRISLEANACGCKTISYQGNPYSDFWLPEGDQRIIAEELVKILNKETPPRDKTPVPSAEETARQMKVIYETC